MQVLRLYFFLTPSNVYSCALQLNSPFPQGGKLPKLLFLPLQKIPDV